MHNLFNTFKQFQDLSGLNINYDKTEIMPLGPLRVRPQFSGNFSVKWTCGPVKVLGIYISSKHKDLIELNYGNRIEEIKTMLNIWRTRDLTLIGKVTVVKHLALPKLIYPLSMLPSPPDKKIQEINKAIYNFIWNGKPDKIKRNILVGTRETGGLQVPHIPTLCSSLKITWVKRLMNPNNTGCWKLFMLRHIPLELQQLIWDCNILYDDLPMSQQLNPFLREILKTWCNMNSNSQVENIDEVAEQILWWNSNIKINKQVVFYKNYINEGVRKVKDVVNDDGTFLTYAEFKERHPGVVTNFLIYHGLISAIPRDWKSLLQRETILMEADDENAVSHSLLLTQLMFTSTPNKLIYNKLVSNIRQFPTNTQAKWSHDIHAEIECENWTIYYTAAYGSTLSTRLHAFHYNFLHRTLVTNELLHILHIKDDNLCTFCKQDVETLKHLFWNCTKVKVFWEELIEWLDNGRIVLNEIDVLLGMENNNNFRIFQNKIYIVAKQFLYYCRCNNMAPNLIAFRNRLCIVKKVEYSIAIGHNKVNRHNELWDWCPDLD